FIGARAHEFRELRRARIFPAVAFAGGRAAADSVSLHVRRIAETCARAGFSASALQQNKVNPCGSKRPRNDCAGNWLGVFPGATNHLALLLRSLDVGWHVAIHRHGGFFLFRLRPPQNRPEGGGLGSSQFCGQEVRMSSSATAGASSYQNFVSGKWEGARSGKTFHAYD